MINVSEKLVSELVSLGCSVKTGEAMKLHTTFKIGGEAALFCDVHNQSELCGALKAVNENNLPVFILGNGSNLLVSDEGINAVVIHPVGEFAKCRCEGEKIIAGAGAQLGSACVLALENSLKGMEFAYGIPGSVGGGAFMNAGAYGGELKDIIEYVDYVNLKGERGRLELADCEFGYRTSAFQKNGLIITSVCFALSKGEKSEIKTLMDDILSRRRDKQPLELPSAGSVFKRPVGYFAGGLIEQCGLKGKTIGGAQVSEKHAGFIVNIGDATCSDVLALIKFIQETVKAETGVELECEVRPIK